LFCSAGYSVVLYDTVASQLTSALESIENQLQQLEKKGLLKGQVKTAAEAFKLVASCDDLEKTLDGVFYVQVSSFSSCIINIKSSIS
jgi:L-gulonate 3-dehydrogenase